MLGSLRCGWAVSVAASWLAVALATQAAASTPPVPAPALAAQGTTEPGAAEPGAAVPVTELLEQLVVSADSTTLYDRALFEHWVDADGDGCDTRREVLIAESAVAPTITAGCAVSGQWFSWYDGASWVDPADVDVDHVVALAEAWRSGAHAWTPDQRRAFGNDLGFTGSLEAVTDEVNQSKGASDPTTWLPPVPDVLCRYLTTWVQVKYRWGLSVDAAEQAVLLDRLLVDCGDPLVEPPTRAETPDPPVTPDPVPQPIIPSPFPDVPQDHPFLVEIAWLAGSGITSGYADGSFRPAATVSRQALAAYLYRYTHAGADAPACTRLWFPDVPVADPFCGEITWLAGTGIAAGYDDGRFRPTGAISRQAMAAFLQRYRAAAAPTTTNCDASRFSDVGVGGFCPQVTWLASTGITTGYADGTFRATAPVTRQALAAYLYRFEELFGPSAPPIVVIPPPEPPPPPPPPPPPGNPGDAVNCGDFLRWVDAQAWFDRYFPYYGDVARLDADGDLIACESRPGAP